MHPYVHLVQALLHPPQPVATFRHQVGLIPHQRPQHADRFLRSERPPQQSATVQPPNPLAIRRVCFLSRPGTRASCRVSTSSTCNPCASNTSCGAIQNTPVLSIATDSARRAFSHSAMRISSAVVAPKLAISRPLPSGVGAHTQCCSLPRSIPATFRRITGNPWSCLRLPSELSISCFPAISLPHLSEHARPGWPCVDSDLGENLAKPRQCTIAFLEPC